MPLLGCSRIRSSTSASHAWGVEAVHLAVSISPVSTRGRSRCRRWTVILGTFVSGCRLVARARTQAAGTSSSIAAGRATACSRTSASRVTVPLPPVSSRRFPANTPKRMRHVPPRFGPLSPLTSRSSVSTPSQGTLDCRPRAGGRPYGHLPVAMAFSGGRRCRFASSTKPGISEHSAILPCRTTNPSWSWPACSSMSHGSTRSPTISSL